MSLVVPRFAWGATGMNELRDGVVASRSYVREEDYEDLRLMLQKTAESLRLATDDLAAARSEATALHKRIAFVDELLGTAMVERDAARAEVEALRLKVRVLRPDAERYWWLRDDMHCRSGKSAPLMSVVAKSGWDRNSSEWCNVADLDAAIDAAREREGGK